MAKKKKEVIDNPQTTTMEERTVYKAFIQRTDNEDMHVDVNGDWFAKTPGAAVVDFLQTLSMDELYSTEVFNLFMVLDDKDEPVPVESTVPIVNKRDRLVIMKLTANDDAEFHNACDGGTYTTYPVLTFATKELKEGYRVAMTEYALDNITALQKKDSSKIMIQRLVMHRVDESMEFPDKIEASQSTKIPFMDRESCSIATAFTGEHHDITELFPPADREEEERIIDELIPSNVKRKPYLEFKPEDGDRTIEMGKF